MAGTYQELVGAGLDFAKLMVQQGISNDQPEEHDTKVNESQHWFGCCLTLLLSHYVGSQKKPDFQVAPPPDFKTQETMKVGSPRRHVDASTHFFDRSHPKIGHPGGTLQAAGRQQAGAERGPRCKCVRGSPHLRFPT